MKIITLYLIKEVIDWQQLLLTLPLQLLLDSLVNLILVRRLEVKALITEVIILVVAIVEILQTVVVGEDLVFIFLHAIMYRRDSRLYISLWDKTGDV